MRRARLLVLMLVSAGHLAAQTGAARSDSARLQGTWTMVAGSADGTAMPPSTASTMKRVLNGNTLTVTMSGQPYFTARIVLDPAKSPKIIDYYMMTGFAPGAVQLGIYSFVGDTVKFCFGSPGAPRPVDCKTSAGDGRTISTWVRARRN